LRGKLEDSEEDPRRPQAPAAVSTEESFNSFKWVHLVTVPVLLMVHLVTVELLLIVHSDYFEKVDFDGRFVLHGFSLKKLIEPH
jgi:hypothetical protein